MVNRLIKDKKITLSQWQIFIIEIVIVTSFFCLYFLLDDNMGRVNEVNILPFARQHADPSWVPQDWYYNLPSSYRGPFIAIFGNFASVFGFLATSIVGRIVAFSLVATGFVFLARTLRLKLILLLVAVTALLLSTNNQGLIAHEWIIIALEPKVIAYGFLLIGISFMLRENYRLMALFLGLTISFHVLVGGWALIAVMIWLLFYRREIFANLKTLTSLGMIYLLAACLAIPPIIKELTTVTTPDGKLDPSYIYVHLRTPHHLNPLSWSLELWKEQPLIYSIIFVITFFILWKWKEHKAVQLGVFALCTMIPFVFGLIIAPLDTQGKLLQYYPFRLGDIMFPLITCLLFVYLLQVIGWKSQFGKKALMLVCLIVLGNSIFVQGKDFYESALTLPQFPSKPQMVSPEWKDMCYWIRDNINSEERFISHPINDINFTWLSERATIVKYKFVPPVSSEVNKWFQRLNDLSGTVDITKASSKEEIKSLINKGYSTLNTEQFQQLMEKYEANYLVTRSDKQLNFNIVYQNKNYILYSQ